MFLLQSLCVHLFNHPWFTVSYHCKLLCITHNLNVVSFHAFRNCIKIDLFKLLQQRCIALIWQSDQLTAAVNLIGRIFVRLNSSTKVSSHAVGRIIGPQIDWHKKKSVGKIWDLVPRGQLTSLETKSLNFITLHQTPQTWNKWGK